MKKHYLIGIIFIFSFLLTSCSTTSINFFQSNQAKPGLFKETWIKKMNSNPNSWTQKADYWYLTGEPNRIERYDQNGPINKVMSVTMVRVPDFTNIQIDGKFQVQIIGQQEHNSVFITGPNAQTRQVVVEIKNNTLCIHQSKDAKIPTNKIIIRIGVHNLCKLTSNGPCLIAGRGIASSNLSIESTDGATIMLTGNMNVSQIRQTGTGTITIIGAYTPTLNIYVKGNGNVNVSGRVGVRTIKHAGNGTVNVIGADSDGLTINAYGTGKTTVMGYVNLKKVVAGDSCCVFVYWVNSNGTYVSETGSAHVGLAGWTKNLNVDIDGTSRFEGRYLHATSAYVTTRINSHANVYPDQKMFASAMGTSSIYFFGSPNMVSRYTTGQAVIIPIFEDSTPPMAAMPQRSFQGPPAWVPPAKPIAYKGDAPYRWGK